MSDQPDPIREGLARGWKVHGGPFAPLPEKLSCDVAIVGTGAGAGITAQTVRDAIEAILAGRDRFDTSLAVAQEWERRAIAGRPAIARQIIGLAA